MLADGERDVGGDGLLAIDLHRHQHVVGASAESVTLGVAGAGAEMQIRDQRAHHGAVLAHLHSHWPRRAPSGHAQVDEDRPGELRRRVGA